MTSSQGSEKPSHQHSNVREGSAVHRRSRRLRERLPIERASRREALPLSYAQERMWFLEQLGIVGGANNVHMAVQLQGTLDVRALEASFDELLCRHEALRTRFESKDGTPIQLVDEPEPFALVTYDLEGLNEKAKQAEVDRLRSAEQLHHFVLSEGPLVRVCLLRLQQQLHILLITIHHIVTDGWSWGIMQRELGALYTEFSQGHQSSLLPLPIQYADYAVWQRKALSGDALEGHLQYWRAKLAGAPSEIEVPTDRPRSPTSVAGARFKFSLEARLRQALNTVAKSEGATLFMALLAAFQLLLSRYTGQQDILVGVPIAGRTHVQTEDLIGFFVNTLVLRSQISEGLSFRELLGKVRKTTLEAYEHQDLPFELLVTDLNPERSLTRQPIFQVVLSMQNYPQVQLRLPGVVWTTIENERASALFELSLHLMEAPDGLKGEFVYATDLFDSETVERMAGHFRILLESIVSDAEASVERLNILTPAERTRLLYEFNQTQSEFPADRPIVELFEEIALRRPNDIAVVCGQSSFTYSEINRKANQLACCFRERGVQIGEFVPVLIQRSLQMVLAQLALLKIGAIYVPLDPSTPAERIKFVLHDCRARRIVSDRSLIECWDSTTIEYISLSKITESLSRWPEGNVALSMPILSPACMMYTSGSTGAPKGVVIPQRAIARLVINNRFLDFHVEDRVAHYSNTAFDASTLEIWGALLNGAGLVIIPQAAVVDPARFAEELQAHRVTVMWITVGLLAQYVRVLAPLFPQLRCLITGGDVVDPRLMASVLSHGSGPQTLLNGYGPTETTTFATTHCVKSIGVGERSVPIGRPISNTQVYILDSYLQPVPIGATGEIYIGGAGVADGYLNRAELTAAKFVADPFGGQSSARLYRSGDFGRWKSDESIEFLGRCDHQVKIRGFRIELGEIEAQLARHRDVGEAVVVVREDVPGEKRVVAYITARNQAFPTVVELRAHLESCLPDYMIPVAFVMQKTLPLTPNGKVDRRALPAPDDADLRTRMYEEPREEVEQKLARIWQELLARERIGRADHFFELGGHSLLVVKALFRVNRDIGCNLTVRDFYQAPTLEGLASRILDGAGEQSVVQINESHLDESVVAIGGAEPPHPQHILLTGGTGFVGRFLLSQLLKDTDATVHCLVRARSHEEAGTRVQDTLVQWGLWQEEYASRIVPLRGDLGSPGFGLQTSELESLSRKIDAVYHCATSMNHLETYSMAKAANVGSIREILRIATSNKPKTINYISTLSVFGPRVDDRCVVDEASSIEGERHSVANGYAASKWIAESILLRAIERGIPCNIFRLGLVWADTLEGRYDELQREYRMIKSSLLSGCGIENYEYAWAPTPVDYAARAIVALGAGRRAGKGIFHISANRQIDKGLFERMNEAAGISLKIMPYYEWVSEIKRLHLLGTTLPIVPLIEYAFSMDEQSFNERQRGLQRKRVRVDCSYTHRILEELGITAPVVSDELIRVCVKTMLVRDTDLRSLQIVE